MAAQEQTRLQIGHVLFIDIVGYSKSLVNQQSELLRELNGVVSGTSQFCESEAQQKLIRLPTGDGMALVFRDSPEAPAQCALEIGRALKEPVRGIKDSSATRMPFLEIDRKPNRSWANSKRWQNGSTSIQRRSLASTWDLAKRRKRWIGWTNLIRIKRAPVGI
jgi:hypothetical protein